MVEDGREWSGTMRFADVATFVSYVRMVPWEVPEDFSVDRYADALLAMTRARPGLHASDVRAGVSTSRPVARSPHSTSTTSRGFR